jgi:hypothetical protein
MITVSLTKSETLALQEILAAARDANAAIVRACHNANVPAPDDVVSFMTNALVIGIAVDDALQADVIANI